MGRRHYLTRAEFIRQYRSQIDRVIRAGGYQGPINDRDRSQWIDNDEMLYLWELHARREARVHPRDQAYA